MIQLLIISVPSLSGQITNRLAAILYLLVLSFLFAFPLHAEKKDPSGPGIPLDTNDTTVTSSDTTDSLSDGANDSIAPTETAPPSPSPMPVSPSRHTAESEENNILESDTSDTLNELKRAELLEIEGKRRSIHYPQHFPSSEHTDLQTGIIFSRDATSWYDISDIKRRAITIKSGIATSFNRFLLYGNTAPIVNHYPGSRLLYNNNIAPLSGEDAIFTNEFRAVAFSGGTSVHYLPHSDSLVSPEISFLWETGVFNENILSLRFSRPITRNFLLNVYSNYRHFDGTEFSHDGNNVYWIYSSVAHDTTLLSHKGYNPLIDEYYCGADATLYGKNVTSFFRVNYGDLSNERAINRETCDDSLDFSRFSQYPLSLFFSSASTMNSPFFITAEGLYASTPIRWIQSFISTTTQKDSTEYDPCRIEYGDPRTLKIQNDNISAAIYSGFNYYKNDSIGLKFSGNRNKIKAADSISLSALQFRPELRWNHPFTFFSVHGETVAEAGYELYIHEDSLFEQSPFFHLFLNTEFKQYNVHFSAIKENLHYLPLPDSLLENTVSNDSYFRTGVELQKKWNMIDLLVGYYWCSEMDTLGVKRAWFSGSVPYRQPRSVFIISPDLGPLKGWSFNSRLMLSDTKPHVKLQCEIALHAFPKLTHESIDVRLGMDYWSERDSVVFAGLSQWHRPITDIYFAASFHIKSFRLTYKIDNLLNRNSSYLPGYYAPGINFRWGFSWFIQR